MGKARVWHDCAFQRFYSYSFIDFIINNVAVLLVYEGAELPGFSTHRKTHHHAATLTSSLTPSAYPASSQVSDFLHTVIQMRFASELDMTLQSAVVKPILFMWGVTQAAVTQNRSKSSSLRLQRSGSSLKEKRPSRGTFVFFSSGCICFIYFYAEMKEQRAGRW